MIKRRRRAPNPTELDAAASLMREVLDQFPAEDDSPRSAAVRRRVEGAIAASELAAGEPAPRVAETSVDESE